MHLHGVGERVFQRQVDARVRRDPDERARHHCRPPRFGKRVYRDVGTVFRLRVPFDFADLKVEREHAIAQHTRGFL